MAASLVPAPDPHSCAQPSFLRRQESRRSPAPLRATTSRRPTRAASASPANVHRPAGLRLLRGFPPTPKCRKSEHLLRSTARWRGSEQPLFVSIECRIDECRKDVPARIVDQLRIAIVLVQQAIVRVKQPRPARYRQCENVGIIRASLRMSFKTLDLRLHSLVAEDSQLP